VYQQQEQQEQQQQQDAENPFLDPPFSRIKSGTESKGRLKESIIPRMQSAFVKSERVHINNSWK
jgi:hypothetical protein